MRRFLSISGGRRRALDRGRGGLGGRRARVCSEEERRSQVLGLEPQRPAWRFDDGRSFQPGRRGWAAGVELRCPECRPEVAEDRQEEDRSGPLHDRENRQEVLVQKEPRARHLAAPKAREEAGIRVEGEPRCRQRAQEVAKPPRNRDEPPGVSADTERSYEMNRSMLVL